MCQFRKHIITEVFLAKTFFTEIFAITKSLDVFCYIFVAQKSPGSGNRWWVEAGANGAVFTEMLMVNFQQYWEIIKMDSMAASLSNQYLWTVSKNQ